MGTSESNEVVEVAKKVKDLVVGAIDASGLQLPMKYTFEIPEEDSGNCTSIFLYDAHEDLSMRHASGARMNAARTAWEPQDVNMQLCFLITFWIEGASYKARPDEPYSPWPAVNPEAGIPALKIVEAVTAALLKHRTLPGIARTFCRVLPPTEQLQSLGQFWQALGNKPRICLTYMVTAPVAIKPGDGDRLASPVVHRSVLVDDAASLHALTVLTEGVRAMQQLPEAEGSAMTALKTIAEEPTAADGASIRRTLRSWRDHPALKGPIASVGNLMSKNPAGYGGTPFIVSEEEQKMKASIKSATNFLTAVLPPDSELKPGYPLVNERNAFMALTMLLGIYSGHSSGETMAFWRSVAYVSKP